jgi:hypothetical protein
MLLLQGQTIGSSKSVNSAPFEARPRPLYDPHVCVCNKEHQTIEYEKNPETEALMIGRLNQ